VTFYPGSGEPGTIGGGQPDGVWHTYVSCPHTIELEDRIVTDTVHETVTVVSGVIRVSFSLSALLTAITALPADTLIEDSPSRPGALTWVFGVSPIFGTSALWRAGEQASAASTLVVLDPENIAGIIRIAQGRFARPLDLGITPTVCHRA